MNKKNSKTIGIIIGIVLFLGVVGGLTYAWLSFTTNNIAVVGTTHCFNINYSKGEDITGNLGRIKESNYVTSNTITISSAMAYTNITMELDSRCYKVNGIGTIELNVNDLSEEYTENGSSPESLKYVLAEYDPNLYSDLTIESLKDKTFNYLVRGSITKEGRIDIYSEYLNPGEKHNYLLIVYIDKDMSTTDVIGESFSGSITARAEQLTETPLNKFLYVLGSDSTTYSSLPIYDFTDDTSTSLSNREEVDYELFEDLTIGEDEILLTGYNGNDKVIYVPDTYTIGETEYRVKILSYIKENSGWEQIGEDPEEHKTHFGSYGTFEFNPVVEEIYLGNNVNAIEYGGASNDGNPGWIEGSLHRAFKADVSLKKAIVPSTITYMDSAFANCYSLEEIDINSESVSYADDLLYNIDHGSDDDEKTVVVKVPIDTVSYETLSNANVDSVGCSTINIIKKQFDTAAYQYGDFYYVKGNGSSTTQINAILTYQLTGEFSTTGNNPKREVWYSLNSPLYLEENEVLLTGYKGNATTLTIPDTITIADTTYNVKILSDLADASYGLLQSNDAFEEIVIGNNVMPIEEASIGGKYMWLEGSMHRMFRDNPNLREVNIPSTVTYMDNTFSYCPNIEEIDINSKYVMNANELLYGTAGTDVTIKVFENSATYDTIDSEELDPGGNFNIDIVTKANTEKNYNNIPNTPYTDFLYVLGSDTTEVSNIRMPIPIYDNFATQMHRKKNNVNVSFDTPLEIEEDEILITGYIGNSNIIKVPDTYTINGNTYNVKIISSIRDDRIQRRGALSDLFDVTEIYLGDNIIGLEYYEGDWIEGSFNCIFRDNASLRKAVLPSTVLSINSAFFGCYHLNDVTIKSGDIYYEDDNDGYGGTLNGTFTDINNNVTIRVPDGTDTYNSINSYKPSNVTLVGY